MDIVVVGAGATGIAAAVSAARSGCTVLLLDQRAGAGGTGGFSGLTTLCGLFDDSGNFLNDGFAREFAEALSEDRAPLRMGRVWVMLYRPEAFRQLAAGFLDAEPGITTRWLTSLDSVQLENQRIVRLNEFEVGAVIDCSGTAEVARVVGAECMATDESTQAPAVIFELRNVNRRLDSPAAITQVLLPLARAGFPALSFQPSADPEIVSIKFTGPPKQATELITFLRQNIPGFEQCESARSEFVQSHRAGRMIVGQHVLTGAEVLGAQKFSDSVARGAWPIEQWGADGVARFRYLPAGEHYEIPARSLRAARIENLFMAGKTLSADADALGSARVMGCCLATGAAAGVLAADFLASHRTR